MEMTECPAYMQAKHQQNSNDLDHTYEQISFHSQDSFDPDHSDPPDYSDPDILNSDSNYYTDIIIP